MLLTKPLRLALPLLGSALMLALTLPGAISMEMSVNGQRMLLSGSIKSGDQYKFRDLIAAHANVKIIELKSTGGNIVAAGEMGRQIREKSLTTSVDGATSVCGSACTILFAAGVQRLYINGEMIKDGPGSPKNGRGLGYHEGNSFLANGKRGQSGSATGAVINWYYEFGAKQAAELATKADWKHFYYVSSPRALQMGLATEIKRK